MTERTENLDIDSAYPLTEEQINRFRRDGFIKQNDWDTWMLGARVGEVIDTPLNPVLYAREG